MSTIQVTIDGATFSADVQLDQGATGGTVTIDGQALRVELPHGVGADAVIWALVGGASYELAVDRQMSWLRSARGLHRLQLRDCEAPVARPASGDGRVKAPIPGAIARLLVAPGQAVEVGQPLLVLEAMKMENQIRAPRAGTVGQINVAVGQSVALGAVLVEIV
jgi:biotin carboxyl carrier protein